MNKNLFKQNSWVWGEGGGVGGRFIKEVLWHVSCLLVNVAQHHIWATSWQNQQNGMCAQRRLRSAWASAQSDQSSLSAWRKLGSLATLWAYSEDSDQPGRCPGWSESSLGAKSFCWFCHEASHFLYDTNRSNSNSTPFISLTHSFE